LCVVYDPNNDVGRAITGLKNEDMMGYSLCALDNELYVIGGGHLYDKLSFMYVPSSMVWKYSSKEDSWTALECMNHGHMDAGKSVIVRDV